MKPSGEVFRELPLEPIYVIAQETALSSEIRKVRAGGVPEAL